MLMKRSLEVGQRKEAYCSAGPGGCCEVTRRTALGQVREHEDKKSNTQVGGGGPVFWSKLASQKQCPCSLVIIFIDKTRGSEWFARAVTTAISSLFY